MRVAAKQYLSSTVGVEFHGKISFLYEGSSAIRPRGSPIPDKQPISRRFRQPTATPTQPLSARPDHTDSEQVAVLKIIDYIRNAEFLALPDIRK